MSRQAPGDAQKFPKYKVPVRVRFNDESVVTGAVFVRQGQRVLDMLCDERSFFPIMMTTGTILANKAHVRQVEVLELSDVAALQDQLPEVDIRYLQSNS
jgi:hypothetical protein